MTQTPVRGTPGYNLRKKRLELGLNMTAFADLVGLALSTYSMVEKNQRVLGRNTAQRLARILSLPLPALLPSDPSRYELDLTVPFKGVASGKWESADEATPPSPPAPLDPSQTFICTDEQGRVVHLCVYTDYFKQQDSELTPLGAVFEESGSDNRSYRLTVKSDDSDPPSDGALLVGYVIVTLGQ